MSIDEVWSWPAAVAALIAGLLFGVYVVVIHIARPAYNGHALWATVGVDALVGSFLFTASQLIAAWYLNDPGWVRIMSRYGPWIVFAIGLAAAVWLGVKVRHRRHT